MFIEIGRVVRRPWVPATAVAVMAGALGLAGVAPAAASQVSVVNCNTNPQALQPAIDGAAQGQTLLVTGTCAGPFTISNDLVVNGVGRAVLDGKGAGRTVTVATGARVRLNGLTITNGIGGISNQGTLAVCNSTISGNTASNGPGGGIFNVNGGTLMVCLSTVKDNYSLGAGGGINNNGTLTVLDSSLSGNSADNCGGIAGNGVTATVTHSSVSHNTARVADGGGICNTVTLSDSVVYGNTAAFGAGIYNNAGTANVTRSKVVHNTASNQGGGIFNVNGGTTTVTRSAVEGNTANGGAGSGGGIYEASGTVTLDQASVRDNNPDNCDPPGSVPGCIG